MPVTICIDRRSATIKRENPANEKHGIELNMKYAVVSVVITAFIMAVSIVTGSCGESAEEADVPTVSETPTVEPGLPTAPDGSGQPAETWNADGVLGDDEYLGEMMFGDYEVRWTSDEQKVYFGIKAKTEGWVSIGLNPSSRMKDADMIFGMVKEGQAIISDQFSTGTFGPHSPDIELGGSDDIIEFAGSEEGGLTTIEFSRALDTGDGYDNTLSRGTSKIIWAYGSHDDFDKQHISRGSGEITL